MRTRKENDKDLNAYLNGTDWKIEFQNMETVKCYKRIYEIHGEGMAR